MKRNIFTVKKILISPELNLVMKNNRFLTKLSDLKEWVQIERPELYKQNIMASSLNFSDFSIHRTVDWVTVIITLDENKDGVFK